MAEIFVGCAGWSLRKETADLFPLAGTHLERYAARLPAVEINSSFYRPHRQATYERWAASTPDGFRFAVKMPKQITHTMRLVDIGEPLDRFLAEIRGLGAKLGVVLVQLPPSLPFQPPVAKAFFAQLRDKLAGPVACEPRHLTWFSAEADALLTHFSVSRVAADPSLVAEAAQPGADQRTIYYRWHGSPRMYYSAYEDDALRDLASQIRSQIGTAKEIWCIFDNTAEGEATRNAFQLKSLLGDASS